MLVVKTLTVNNLRLPMLQLCIPSDETILLLHKYVNHGKNTIPYSWIWKERIFIEYDVFEWFDLITVKVDPQAIVLKPENSQLFPT